ncbi:MAG: integrin alpha [Pseudomonadota bacterium]
MMSTRPASLPVRLLLAGVLPVCLAVGCGEEKNPADDTGPGDTEPEDTGGEDTGGEDSPCELPDGVLPVEGADVTIVGDPGDEFGWPAAGIGDVNGDGYDDVWASTWEYGGSPGIWFGPLEGGLGGLDDDTPDVVIDGWAASAGDLNADGLGDLVSVSRGDETYGAFLVYGPLSGGETYSYDVADAWIFTTQDRSRPTDRCSFGHGADEFHGVLLGAGGDFTSGDWAGAVYGFVGAVEGEMPLTDASFLLLGEEGDTAGDALAGPGDIDGDGVTDLAVGAPSALSEDGSWPGAAYVISGPVSGTLSLADADAKLLGDVDGAAAGYSMAATGDIDGDGSADLLVGALSSSESTGSWDGIVYVVLGSVQGVHSLAEAEIQIQGGNGGDSLGMVVAGQGDYDGDGTPDLALSYTLVPYCYQSALIYFAPAPGVYGAEDADVTIASSEVLEGVALAGDVNGDDLDDLLIGSPGYGQDDHGDLFLWYGRGDWGL